MLHYVVLFMQGYIADNRELLMKARIVQIGNSRGIRLPKLLLEEAQLSDEVELQAARLQGMFAP